MKINDTVNVKDSYPFSNILLFSGLHLRCLGTRYVGNEDNFCHFCHLRQTDQVLPELARTLPLNNTPSTHLSITTRCWKLLPADLKLPRRSVFIRYRAARHYFKELSALRPRALQNSCQLQLRPI